MTKLINTAGSGGTGPAETTAKLTDLSDSDIVIDNIFIVCRHVIISKRAISYLFYSSLNTVCSTFNL